MNLKIQTKSRAYEFPTEDRTSLLLAGLSEGLDLPYACATGTCGTCKAKLVSGTVIDNWANAPGKTKLNADAGEVLLCQCSAQSNGELEILVPEFVYRTDPGATLPRRLKGVVTSWRALVSDVALWEVELSEVCEFNSGQFALISFSGVEGYRAYSMVNFDQATRKLTFLTKRTPEGKLTNALFSENPVGRTVQVVVPLGRAIFTPGLKRNILCIAGGSGIAGIMSILARATQEGYFEQYKGYVFFGVRTMQDAFFLEELSAFKRASEKGLQIVIGLSGVAATDEEKAQYSSLSFDFGMIHEIAAKHMEGKYKNVQVYLAGPAPSVEASIRQLVITEKLDPKLIAYDKFS